MTGEPLLQIADLRVRFGAHAPDVLHGVDLEVHAGEMVALVGESGSGKSVTALATLGLLPRGAAVSGQVRFDGQDLLGLPKPHWQQVRGASIGMVFQEPMNSLNPVLTIGRQLTEALCLHRGLSETAARAAALDMLDRVAIAQPAQCLLRYPHELSGGMRQRAMLAMAMLPGPRLLIADEPTTALDVTVQAQVLDLMRRLAREQGSALLLITHDMGVVAEVADTVLVMHKGRVVERNSTARLFAAPAQAYTRALLAAVPSLRAEGLAPAAPAAEVLRLRAIGKTFAARGWFGRRRADAALRSVDLELHAGETLALVGESGSGKSTLGRIAARLLDADRGTVEWGGRDARALRGAALRAMRTEVQIVFQDPYASLNPRRRILDSVAEPLVIHGMDRTRAATQAHGWLERVGLPPGAASRYPHEFSGGQRQRIAIARAMVCAPRLVVADEPTSALDVSIQAQVLDLFRSLQNEHGVAFLFITHDLAVARRVAHRVAVMRRGELVEVGPSASVIDTPQHAYTRALVAAVPLPDPARRNRARLEVPQSRDGGAWTCPLPGHWVRAEERS